MPETTQTPAPELKVVDKRHHSGVLIEGADGKTRLDPEMDPQNHTHREWLAKMEETLEYGPVVPLFQNVLVRQYAKETMFEGTKFYIPTSAQTDPKMGVVVAVGPQVSETELKPGDLVKMGDYSAEDVEYLGEKFLLLDARMVKFRRPLVGLNKPVEA